jgi:hypothetical protein
VDEILSTLLYLIPVAFFIFIRLKGARKKSAPPKNESLPRRQEPRRSGEAGKPEKELSFPDLFGKFMNEEAVPQRDSGGDKDGDAVFEAAWREFRSSPEPEEPPRPAPEFSPVKPAVPDYTPTRAEPRFSPLSAGTENSLPKADSTPKFSPEIEPVKPRPDFSARLAALGPLGRAVVMAEVLGKPKALKSEYDS